MENEPATKHDVTEGGVLGTVGGAVVGGLAGGPVGAVVGAVVGGAASAGAVDAVDKHDSDNLGAATGAAYHNSADDLIEDDGHVSHVAANNPHVSSAPGIGYGSASSATTAAPVSAGYRTSAVAAAATTSTLYDDNAEAVIPVVEEELVVGKRETQMGGVRVSTTVTETPVEESVILHDESVTVNRTAVNRVATDADFAASAVDITLTETREEAVVSKQARVVEEVIIGKTATDRTETIHDTVRKTNVEVEQVDGKTVRDSSY